MCCLQSNCQVSVDRKSQWGLLSLERENMLDILKFACVFFFQGLILMSISMSVKGLRPPDCPAQVNCRPATEAQVAIFYFSIYVVAVGCGGIIPCLSPFGANQFNEEDEKERRMKRSFFNYWGIAIAGGGAIAVTGRWLAVMNLTKSISRLILVSFSKVHICSLRWNCVPIVWRKDSEGGWSCNCCLSQHSSMCRTMCPGDGATQFRPSALPLQLSCSSPAQQDTETNRPAAAPWHKLPRFSQPQFGIGMLQSQPTLPCSMRSMWRGRGMSSTQIRWGTEKC